MCTTRTDISSVGTGGRVQRQPEKQRLSWEHGPPATAGDTETWAANRRESSPGLRSNRTHPAHKQSAVLWLHSVSGIRLALVFKMMFAISGIFGLPDRRLARGFVAADALKDAGTQLTLFTGSGVSWAGPVSSSRAVPTPHRPLRRATHEQWPLLSSSNLNVPISPSLQVQNLATVNKAETNHCSPIS